MICGTQVQRALGGREPEIVELVEATFGYDDVARRGDLQVVDGFFHELRRSG